MLRKVMPYVPYAVVIVSLIVAIIMVITLNGQNTKPSAPKKADTTHETKTAGNVTSDTDPAYKVKTAPDSRPTVSAPSSTPKKSTPVAAAPSAAPKTAPVATPAAATVAVAPPAQTSGELANSGPGEVIALFGVNVAFAAGIHSFYLRRKLEA